MTVDVGAVDRFVTAGRPARALGEAIGVIGIANVNFSVKFLFLEMTLEAEIGVSLRQHTLISRAVRRMTRDATLAHGAVLKHERTALRSVALRAGLIFVEQSSPSTFDRNRQVRFATFEGHAPVRVVTIGAAHFAFEHRMAMRQLEFGANL